MTIIKFEIMQRMNVDHHILIAKKNSGKTGMRGTIDDMISIRDPPRPNPQNALIVRIGRYTSYTAPSHSKNVHTLLDQKMKNVLSRLKSGNHRSILLQNWFNVRTKGMNDEQVMRVLYENMTHTRLERTKGENAYCFITNVMARA